ncbi:hypothetical protein BS50DRAFT_152666 [Corynespora cassiicola Philippines]|uniref:Uncharacterized protein n=1 Tax=Corynespora cassiicola Philippines TaxID=1448308 RepID=A0A2T2N8B8_CORCC|nr:hypothetical protein BS50DRAFT_152666 [Corynespora cassiicola Philippines]
MAPSRLALVVATQCFQLASAMPIYKRTPSPKNIGMGFGIAVSGLIFTVIVFYLGMRRGKTGSWRFWRSTPSHPYRTSHSPSQPSYHSGLFSLSSSVPPPVPPKTLSSLASSPTTTPSPRWSNTQGRTSNNPSTLKAAPSDPVELSPIEVQKFELSAVKTPTRAVFEIDSRSLHQAPSPDPDRKVRSEEEPHDADDEREKRKSWWRSHRSFRSQTSTPPHPLRLHPSNERLPIMHPPPIPVQKTYEERKRDRDRDRNRRRSSTKTEKSVVDESERLPIMHPPPIPQESTYEDRERERKKAMEKEGIRRTERGWKRRGSGKTEKSIYEMDGEGADEDGRRQPSIANTCKRKDIDAIMKKKKNPKTIRISNPFIFTSGTSRTCIILEGV